MSLFCELTALTSESDVEQKFFWPLLTDKNSGLGFEPGEVVTKGNIKQFGIEKGEAAKVYRPDYIVVLCGLPTVVCEVKRPGENLEEALREARLYAAELNSKHPSNINPCIRIVVSDGTKVLSSPADTTKTDFEMSFSDVSLSNQKYGDFRELLSPGPLRAASAKLRRKMVPNDFQRPMDLIGGEASKDEDVSYNDFGRRLSVDYLHVFNPQTREHRAHIVRNAYVASKRREHYVDEIDRVIRMALPSPVPGSTLLDEADNPAPLIRLLKRGRDLVDKLFLLIGPVGSGKSTFVDFFREVKLPAELAAQMVWATVDMNKSPHEKKLLEEWVVGQIIKRLEKTRQDVDWADPDVIEKMFAVELRRTMKLREKYLTKGSDKYKEAIYDEVQKLLADPIAHVTALARYLCGDTSKLLIIVFDNCDKGSRDEQLLVFQIVKWLQSWLTCLVFLPIRDVTYYTCKEQPPLDTVIPEFVFRIETPPFTEVLRKRINLALTEMTHEGGRLCEYYLESGMKVVYPATDLGYYLACIQKSIYDHDRLLRKMMLGLAGRNMRKAMAIFLDFCKSGHIGEQEYLLIRTSHGKHSLPYGIITRVLLRGSNRYYNGDTSHVKNLFQCDPTDLAPDHMVRLSILSWLQLALKTKGPTGILGFHRCDLVISELVPLGHDEARVRKEIKYLVKAMCILTEHQRNDDVQDNELIRISTAGVAHMSMLSNVHYVAACAEDTWMNNHGLAIDVANRIGSKGMKFHYSKHVLNKNAVEFVDYLLVRAESEVARPASYLKEIPFTIAEVVSGIRSDIVQRVFRQSPAWPEVDGKYLVGTVYPGKVRDVKDFGIFVTLETGLDGLAHVTRLPHGKSVDSFSRGDPINVKIERLNSQKRQISLSIISEQV